MKAILLTYFRPASCLLLIFTIICGILYPLFILFIGKTVFPVEAAGSLLTDGDKIIGSQLLGQEFQSEYYFHGRPSATVPPYNAAYSGTTHMSPVSKRYRRLIEGRLQHWDIAENAVQAIPIELLTASASGLDPHITPEAARFQANRIAGSRQVAPSEVLRLVESSIEQMQFGLMGRARVNVLLLNRRLDAVFPVKEAIHE